MRLPSTATICERVINSANYRRASYPHATATCLPCLRSITLTGADRRRPPMDPNGKVAIVTGGGSGIGRATSTALANAGASVVVADMNQAGGAETVGAIESARAKAAFVLADVRKRADLDTMVAFA